MPRALEHSLKALAIRALPGINQTRRLSAVVGVLLLLGLGFVPEGSVADRLALIALVVLSFGTAAGWLELLSQGDRRQAPDNRVQHQSDRAWGLVAIVVLVVAGLAVQTWFRPGTTIGGGDLVPPNGTTWLVRLFEPWTWGGSTLGEPSQLPLRLPWAAMLSLVHTLGGNPALAQRIFYTTLYAAAGLAALGLLASLRMGPVAALAGTVVYLTNPYVVTWVNTYDVYLAALFLLPAIPAVLVAAGTGRFSMWWSALMVAAASPLLGFAFSEPPLVGMILVAMFSAPVLVAWVDGKDAALRSLRVLLLVIPLLLATSAYWMVPAIVHLSEAHLSSSGILLGFNWTGGELRTTIRNAFWLNTRWLWIAPEYFPYAKAYDAFPLSVFSFVLPALAFSALALARARRSRDHSLRLVVAAATAALFLIFFSTGTKPPGNIIFDRLYNLPFGWFLQEPERFIMVVALVYGILIAAVVDALFDHQSITDLARLWRLGVPALRLSVAPVALGTALLVGFPLYTGALVPDTGPPLPIWANHARTQHVAMPNYWSEMAQFTDALPIQGAVLIMPPDDYYEMPYTWYYGSDAFIAESFTRHVLVPSDAQSSQLSGAVSLTGESILRRDWRQTEALLAALDAPLILVRRDIVTPYPQHSILSPADLAAALSAAPDFVMVRQIGALELFALNNTLTDTQVGMNYVMMNTQAPDLRLLSVIPPNTALVTGQSNGGGPYAAQAPPFDQWQSQGNALVWQRSLASGWAYRIAELQSKTVVPLDHSGTFLANPDAPLVYSSSANQFTALSATPGARAAISNGDFTKGLWGPVIDCHPATPGQTKPTLRANLVANGAPGGLPALQLSASSGSACVNRSLDWHGGALLLSLLVDQVQGAIPDVCLWELGPNRCALIPSIVANDGWSTYQAAVTPDVGTTNLSLYLYADAYQAQGPTISEYAHVNIEEIPRLPTFVVAYSPNVPDNVVTVSAMGRGAIANGDFSQGLWEAVADCNAIDPVQAKSRLRADVLPNAAPGGLAALELSASLDSACERQTLDWRGGSLLINMMVNHVQGASPQICVWEVGPNHCASLSSIPEKNGWSTYRVSVSPDPGTRAVILHLYADASQPGGRTTTNEYADVRAIELPAQSGFALLANPDSGPPSPAQLVVVHSTFSTQWQGPTNSKHVLVDGMLNGWLMPTGSKAFTLYYAPTNAFRAAGWISLAAYLLMLLMLVRSSALRLAGRLGFRWRQDANR